MLVYIAGRMRGIKDDNFPAFDAAAATLRAAGYDVINPAELTRHGMDFTQCMALDLPLITRCDMIVVLPGWRKSVGAGVETHLAKACGIPIREYERICAIIKRSAADSLRPCGPCAGKCKEVANATCATRPATSRKSVRSGKRK